LGRARKGVMITTDNLVLDGSERSVSLGSDKMVVSNLSTDLMMGDGLNVRRPEREGEEMNGLGSLAGFDFGRLGVEGERGRAAQEKIIES